MDLLRLGPDKASSDAGAERCRDIKRWTRELLALPDHATVIVSESRCSETGCAPLEVIVAVFEPRRARRACRIHVALAEVGIEELHRAWQSTHLPEDHTHE